MKFRVQPAPHLTPANKVSLVMRRVLLALIPAALAFVYYFGPGLIFNMIVAAAFALGAEALMLKLRGKNLRYYLGDSSALVTAVLLAFTLPPMTPWWVTATGALFAIVVAKHLFGGIGHNPFNPAMVGFVVLLISFPVAMTNWIPPRTIELGVTHPGVWDMLVYLFTGHLPGGVGFDAISSATPLDETKTQLGLARNISEIRAGPLFGRFGAKGWESINNFFALGGIWLIYKGVIRWHIPVAMLGTLFVLSTIFYLSDTGSYAPPGFQLFTGAAIFGAFFIATDPVTAPSSNRGRLIYGAGIGVGVYLIRTFGGFPDGVAFSVLFMNMCSPLINHYTQPRVYGHDK